MADLTLISIGYLFLISTWIDCWKKHVDAGSPPPHPVWVTKLQKILQMTFIAAVATAIASGVQASNAFQSDTGRSQVIALRHASCCLSLGKCAFPPAIVAARHKGAMCMTIWNTRMGLLSG